MFWTIFGPLLDHFWTTTGPLLDHYWTTFGPLLDHFCTTAQLDHFWTTFGPLLDHFWTTFGPLSDLFWIIFGPPHVNDLLKLGSIFFVPIRTSMTRSCPTRGSTPRQSQGSLFTSTNPLSTIVPTVIMTRLALLEKLSNSKTREDASLVFLREAAQS